MNILTLYKVSIKNLKSFYVVAENPSQAYEKTRKFLDDNDWYIIKYRELDTIEVIADDYKNSENEMLIIDS